MAYFLRNSGWLGRLAQANGHVFHVVEGKPLRRAAAVRSLCHIQRKVCLDRRWPHFLQWNVVVRGVTNVSVILFWQEGQTVS